MKKTENLSLNKISWLKFYSDNHNVNVYYEPETTDELISLVTHLYGRNRKFIIIGHATNTYFLPNAKIDVVISTRLLRNYSIKDNEIICECGVNVASLSTMMVERGYAGFEGLINLPGTVASAVYGNSSCYDCSINSLLKSFTLLTPDGSIINCNLDWLEVSHRSTCLKRNENQGVIINVVLNLNMSNPEALIERAKNNRKDRKSTQPSPQHNLGSIFRSTGTLTLKGVIVKSAAKLIYILAKLILGKKSVGFSKIKIELILLRAQALDKYVYSWNCYRWLDPDSHIMFWKYVELRNKIYRDNIFEIEFKGDL